MKDAKRCTIAVMMRDITYDFLGAMYDGFYQAANEENVNLVYLLGPQVPENVDDVFGDSIDVDYDYQLDSVFDYVNILKPDALIIVSGSLYKSLVLPDINALVERYKDIPTLVLETIPHKPGVSYQVADCSDAMRRCLEHLIIHHRYSNIVYVSGDTDEYDFKERLRVFTEVLNEHCIDVDEDHIIICKNDEHCERKIHAIFDDFPYVDAIVCSSDYYADIAYQICEKRGLVVGKDVAITGFDDLGGGVEKNPPLTGIMHNSFTFGYDAIKRAISVANGVYIGGVKTGCQFNRRASCGCRQFKGPEEYSNLAEEIDSKEEVKEYILSKIPMITADVFMVYSHELEKKAFGELYTEFMTYVYENIYVEWKDIALVHEFVHKYILKIFAFSKISVRSLSIRTDELLEALNYMVKGEKDNARLTALSVLVNREIKEAELERIRQVNLRRREQLWFVPFFTRDLMKSNVSYSDTISFLLKRLRDMRIKSAQLYLFRKPVICKKNQLPPAPTEVYQAGYYNEHEFRVFLPQNSITINWDNGISSFLSVDEGRNYSAFVLYSSERQYGIMLYEVEKEDVFFAMTCSLQIGSLLHFRQVCDEEEAASIKLKEQNEILSYISDRDDLTGTLNWRGFLEKSARLVFRYSGRYVTLVFADIDGLNDINNRFGHLAGDKTIITAADFLRKALPTDSLIGRIGGDEFVTIIPTDDIESVNNIANKLKQMSNELRKFSDEEYYPNIIIKSYTFMCYSGMNMTELLKEAEKQAK